MSGKKSIKELRGTERFHVTLLLVDTDKNENIKEWCMLSTNNKRKALEGYKRSEHNLIECINCEDLE